MTSLREALGYSSELAEVFRHLSGQHDQKTHGRKGGGETLSFTSLDDAMAWGERRGINVTFGPNDVSVEGAQQACQAVEDMMAKYPHMSGAWGDEHPNGFYRNKDRGLRELELGAKTSFGAGAEVTQVAKWGQDPSSKMLVQEFNDDILNAAGNSSAIVPHNVYQQVAHEMGHVAHNSIGHFRDDAPAIIRVGALDPIIKDAQRKVWKDGRRVDHSLIASDLSHYAGSGKINEFFAEAFTAKNVPGVFDSLSPAAQGRLSTFADLVNESVREQYGLDGGTI